MRESIRLTNYDGCPRLKSTSAGQTRDATSPVESWLILILELLSGCLPGAYETLVLES